MTIEFEVRLEDAIGIRLSGAIGTGNMMWGSD
jgi:hypothetical protein